MQLVVEQEARSDFHPFDVATWEASRGQSERKTMTANGTLQTVDTKIADMIDANLPNAITYRRRDFEVDAMMHELCRGSGIVLPPTPTPPWPVDKPAVRVFVICCEASASGVLQELQDAQTSCSDIRRVAQR